MERAHDPQVVPVEDLAVLGCRLGGCFPRAADSGGHGAQQAHVVSACRERSDRSLEARDCKMRARARIRFQMNTRILERVPLSLLRHDFPIEQSHDGVHGLHHAIARAGDRDVQHVRIGGQRSGAEAEHGAPAGLVIELHDPIGHHQRVVVRKRDDGGAQLDPRSPLCRSRDEQLRRAVDLHAPGVVLAQPELRVPELLEPLHELEVALHRQRGIFVVRVMRWSEDANANMSVAHCRLFGVENGS